MTVVHKLVFTLNASDILTRIFPRTSERIKSPPPLPQVSDWSPLDDTPTEYR